MRPKSNLDFHARGCDKGALAAAPIGSGQGVTVIPDKGRAGAYVLHLTVYKPLHVRIRTLGVHVLAPGRYLYVGSARRGMASRCARHERLAREKTGKVRWHIDYLLVDLQCGLARIDFFPGAEECRVSRRIALRKGIAVPIPGFGATDCRSGCRAHLYRFAEGKHGDSHQVS